MYAKLALVPAIFEETHKVNGQTITMYMEMALWARRHQSFTEAADAYEDGVKMDLSQSLPTDIELTEAKTVPLRPRSRSISAGTTPMVARDRPGSAKSSLRLVRSRARPSSARGVSRKNNSSNLPCFLLHDKVNDCRVGTQKIEATFASIKEKLATMTEAHRSMIDRLNRLNAALHQLQNAHTCELLAAPELPALVAFTKPRATVTFSPEVLFHIVERRTSSTDTQYSDDRSTDKRDEDAGREVSNNDSGLSEVEEVFS